MAVVSGQRTIGTSPTYITNIPPGPANLVLINASSAKNVYIADNANVSITDAVFIPPLVPVNVPYFPGSAGHALYGVTDTGTAVITFIITSPGF